MDKFNSHFLNSVFIFFILICSSYTLIAQEAVFNSYKVIRIHPGVDGRGFGGLNDSSEVAGGLDDKIFHWTDTLVSYYPSPYNDICAVTGMNNSSEISGALAGYGLYGAPYDWVAVKWIDGSPLVLGTITGELISAAYGMNEQGIAVGYSVDTVDNEMKHSPVIFDNYVYYIGDLIGNTNLRGACFDINDNGVIVGAQYLEPGAQQAFKYSIGGAFIELVGDGGVAFGINNINQIVGTVAPHPTLWDNSIIPTYLNGSGYAYAINDSSVIVGAAFFSSTQSAAIWKNTKVKDLNKLILDDENVFLSRATRINNKNEILCFGKDLSTNEDYYFLLTYDSTKIIKPRADDIFIAGEKDTIEWFSVWDTETLNLEYSTDGGETYQPLAQNVPNDSCKYIWDVPDEIFSAKCYIKIIDATSLEVLKVSDKFGIRPYVLTRTDPVNDELIVYDPLLDMWGFENDSSDVWPEWWWIDERFNYEGIDPFTGMQYPQWIGDSSFFNAQFTYYPDWPSFVRAFSALICYRSIEYGVYNIKAVKKWYDVADEWGGSCFGIAGTNALAFMHRDEFLNKFPSFPYFENPVSVTSDSGVINAVAELFSHQYGNPSKANDISGSIKTANQTLRDLKSMFRKSDVVKTLTLINQGGSGGHTIIPYKLEKDEYLDYIYYLYVYDNSYSYLLDAKIRFDTSGYNNMGIWEAMYGWGSWGGNYGIYLEVPSDKYLGYAELEENKSSKSNFNLAATEIEVFCSRGTDILIKNSVNGQIGYQNGQLIKEMPEAFPLMIKNGSESPPYGYSLTEDVYSIATSNFSSSKASLDIFTGDKIFTVSRQGTASAQVDKVYYSTGQRIGISNSQSSSIKKFKFSEIISNEQLDKMFVVRNLDMEVNDSLDFVNPENGQLKITNIGSGKDYEIELEYADNQRMRRFLNESIILPVTSSHTLIPDWTDINQIPLTILVDLGNDGTIDDTLEIVNQVMGVREDEGWLIPIEYRLEQNYPNPFNNSTIIKYSIPMEGLVTLKVFNIIGEEVITLVNEVKPAANYQIAFNSAQLPSGVYFYQLRAGDFVETKKMVLMR